MKILLNTMTAVAVLGLACSPAMANDPATKQLTISGTVKTVATLPDPVPTGTSNNGSVSGSAVSITDLANGNLLPNATSISVKYPQVVTNYTTVLTLHSANGGLKKTLDDGTTMPAGFTNLVHYQAFATLQVTGEDDDNLATLDTTTSNEAESTERQPYTGDIILTVAITAPTNPTGVPKLIEGTYNDTLTLKIGSSL